VEILSFRTPGLGDQTYVLAHEGQAVLVDPQRDIDRFLGAVAERDLQLRYVLETHLHNDYVSGAEQAARTTGAELVLPAASAAAYDHTPAFHLEDIGRGALTVRPIHTPGHTPEHTSYVVLVEGEPVALFSGGSLLVGSAGRPDLLGPERARTLGKLQYGSVHRLAAYPGELGLFPTHGAGSFCTATGAGQYTSTVGDEVTGNPLLQLPDADAFADQLLAAPMPIPAFYKYMGPTNTLGVKPMPDTTVPELKVGDLAAMKEGTTVVDIRPRARLAAGMLPGSTAVELDTDFGSWAGWLVPYGSPMVLVADRDQDVAEAVTQLAQIGIDSVQGVVFDLPAAEATTTFELLDLEDFRARLKEPGVQRLDVRMPNERASVAWPDAIETFAADLFTSGIPDGLDRDRPVMIACGSGRRAVIAASLLAREGYKPVVLDRVGVPELVAADRKEAA
jgi:glyoxylase-like metal-dependent hydrolase (beta-lactamase superfamily II)/rhodanese-related sulfurtransferase